MLIAGQAVSFIGDALFPVALAFAVLDDLDGTPGQLGLVLAAQALPLALLVLAAGVWADRLPRQRIMLVSDLGRAAVQCAIAALLLSGAAELWMLIVLVALYGVFEAGFRPAAGGLVPQLAGPDHLQQANALMGLGQNVGMVLGPTLGGLLVVGFGSGAAIAVDAGTFVVSAIFLVRMGSPPSPAAGTVRAGFLTELRGGFAEVRRRRWMWSFMPALSAYHLIALPCVLALGPVIADRELGRRRQLVGDRGRLRDRLGRGGRPVAAARAGPADARVRAVLRRRRLPADHHRLRRLDGGDRGIRAAGRDRRHVRLHAVGDDAWPRDPGAGPVARDVAGLVHDRGGDAARVRGRGGRGRRDRDPHHDARLVAGRDRSCLACLAVGDVRRLRRRAAGILSA